jgi:hypothetical protein
VDEDAGVLACERIVATLESVEPIASVGERRLAWWTPAWCLGPTRHFPSHILSTS